MESGISVYKRVIPGADLRETIQKCLVIYEDKLLARSNLPDDRPRNEKMRDEEKEFEIENIILRHADTFLPDKFKGKGYSRLRAVYAYPSEFPEDWCYPNLIPEDQCHPNRNGVTEGETVMRMRVDGSSALVLPMRKISEIYMTEFYSIFPFDEDRNMATIREYWASAVSLEEFTRDFKHPNGRDNAWRRRPTTWHSQGKRTIKNFWRSRSDRRRKIQDPEVIIPEWALEKVSFLNAS